MNTQTHLYSTQDSKRKRGQVHAQVEKELSKTIILVCTVEPLVIKQITRRRCFFAHIHLLINKDCYYC
jgi:hypothetical protein